MKYAFKNVLFQSTGASDHKLCAKPVVQEKEDAFTENEANEQSGIVKRIPDVSCYGVIKDISLKELKRNRKERAEENTYRAAAK